MFMAGINSCELLTRVNCWDCTKYDSVLKRTLNQQVCGEDSMRDYENNGWTCK